MLLSVVTRHNRLSNALGCVAVCFVLRCAALGVSNALGCHYSAVHYTWHQTKCVVVVQTRLPPPHTVKAQSLLVCLLITGMKVLLLRVLCDDRVSCGRITSLRRLVGVALAQDCLLHTVIVLGELAYYRG